MCIISGKRNTNSYIVTRGCAIVCVSEKLELLEVNGEVNQKNAHEFAINDGAEEEVATEFVAEASDCVTQHKGVDDECLRALPIAKCFRTKNKDLD
ncbi:unnamed protein product [Parnassius apollo]|uniref:(apollo) hypothetical protein n=1 Tax=Parnassius apollo TaxID=110799 RepID=A0A8S3XE29_PARAO|nr:unnamed protein product [Parnassius apollo]